MTTPEPPPPQAQITEEFGLRALHFDQSTVQSVMALGDPDLLVLDYTRAMMAFLLFVPQPRHIVMIGLGGGSLAKHCLRTLPETRVTVVEIDPAVIAMRAEFAVPPDDERFQVICADGADHVRNAAAGDADVLMVDGFLAEGLPPQLASADFYAACRAMLAPGGVMVLNHWAADPAYPVYVARLRAAFDGRLLAVPAEEGDNRISFAGRDAPFPPRRAVVQERRAALHRTHGSEVAEASRRVLERLNRSRMAAALQGWVSPDGRQAAEDEPGEDEAGEGRAGAV